jgi:hypothetical protein
MHIKKSSLKKFDKGIDKAETVAVLLYYINNTIIHYAEGGY